MVVIELWILFPKSQKYDGWGPSSSSNESVQQRNMETRKLFVRSVRDGVLLVVLSTANQLAAGDGG